MREGANGFLYISSSTSDGPSVVRARRQKLRRACLHGYAAGKIKGMKGHILVDKATLGGVD